jgi:sugar O-acyltransferase (sialic acid O-acetyltransferase NeuD family)
MTKRIIILGTGGNAVDILDVIADINLVLEEPAYECLGFLDDDSEKKGMKIQDKEILGPLEEAKNFPEAFFVNGIGSAKSFLKKRKILEKTGLSREAFITLVHPSVMLSSSVRLGRGCVLYPHVVIGSEVELEEQVTVLPGSVISHGCRIAWGCCLAAGVRVSGEVELGESVYLGTGSCLRERITVGAGSLIGMGSVVLDDVPGGWIVFGNPAKTWRRLDD